MDADPAAARMAHRIEQQIGLMRARCGILSARQAERKPCVIVNRGKNQVVDGDVK